MSVSKTLLAGDKGFQARNLDRFGSLGEQDGKYHKCQVLECDKEIKKMSNVRLEDATEYAMVAKVSISKSR